MRIVESFSNWITSYEINENISAAKIFMQKRYAKRLRKEPNALTPEELVKAVEDPIYKEVIDMVQGYPGYAMSFIKFHFDHGATLEQLAELLKVIQTEKYIIQQLPKTIDQYSNAEPLGNIKGFEQLMDAIRTVKRSKEAKWLVDRLPKRLRDGARSLDIDAKNTLVNAAIKLTELDTENPVEQGKLSISARLLTKIKQFDTEGWQIEEVLDYIVKYIKGFSNLDLSTKIKAIEALDPEAGVLYSDDQYLVMSMRTEKAQKDLCSIANWCINRGQFNSYASKGLQVNIFNFGLDPTDKLFLTGTTISFGGKVTDSHDINDRSIKGSDNPVYHFTQLGYPSNLVKTVVRQLSTEFMVKRVVANLNLDKLKPAEVLFNIIKSSYLIDPTANTDSLDTVLYIVETRIKSSMSEEEIINLYSKNGILSLFSAKLFKMLLPNPAEISTKKILDNTIGLFAELNSIHQTDLAVLQQAPHLTYMLSQEKAILNELGLTQQDVEEVMESIDHARFRKLIMEFIAAEPMTKPVTKPARPTTKPATPSRPSPIPNKQPFKQPEPAKAEADDVIKRYTLLTNEKF